MTHRSTTRAQRPARRPRPARRARQSLAVTMMVVGLVVGAFAAPSMAEDGTTGGTAIQVAAADDNSAAPAAGLSDVLDPPGQGETPGGGGGPSLPEEDDDCPGVGNIDLDPADGCQNQGPCELVPDQDGCPVIDPEPEPECPEGTEDLIPGNGQCDTIEVPGDGDGDGDGDGGTGNGGGGTGNGGGGTGNGGGGTGNGGGGTGNGGGGTGSGGGGTGNGVVGTTGGGGNPSLGTSLGVAEGNVPGSEGAAAVSSCSDSVICQSAPAATSTGSSAEGLPETGAPADSGQLVAVGVGLLLAGGLLLKPGRRGRHRLVAA